LSRGKEIGCADDVQNHDFASKDPADGGIDRHTRQSSPRNSPRDSGALGIFSLGTSRMLLNRLFAALFSMALVIPPGSCGLARPHSVYGVDIGVSECCHVAVPAKTDRSDHRPSSIPPRCLCVKDGIVLQKVALPSDQASALTRVAIVDPIRLFSSTEATKFVPAVDPPRLRLHVRLCVWRC
jgi:hypothetical protein